VEREDEKARMEKEKANMWDGLLEESERARVAGR
jgi:hypothetical protein